MLRYGSWYLLGSVMVSTKLASPIMRAQGSGSIIFNGSMAAQQANHGDPLYSAANAGMSNYTKSAARKTDPHRLKGDGVSLTGNCHAQTSSARWGCA